MSRLLARARAAWDGARERVAVAVHARLDAPPPPLARPPDPIPGLLGEPFLRPDGDASGDPVAVPADWAEASREAHAHAWFAELARRHAAGDVAAGEAAITGLQAWLRHDRPGQGPAWAHPGDAALRVLHQAAGFAWLGAAAPPELVAAAQGSAAWHLDYLGKVQLGGRANGHRRVLHHAARVVGGLTFVGAPGAREAWSSGLSALGPELDALVHPDGSAVAGAPRWLERTLWATALAFAAAWRAGAAPPAVALAAFVRGTNHLGTLAAGLPLPALGQAPPLQILPAPGVLSASLAALAASWGIGEGAVIPGDRRVAWLGRGGGGGAAAGGVVGRGGAALWSAWSFRDGGIGVATLAVKSEVLRVGFDAQPAAGTFSVPAPLQLVADLGARPLLVGPDGAAPNGLDQGGGVLDVVRVDGKKARLEGHVPHRPLGWEREVLLNQQRIRVTDRTAGGAVALTWTFGPDWAIEGAGGAWTLRSGPYTVIVELPAALSWRQEGSALRGEGRCAAGEALRSGFEVRG